MILNKFILELFVQKTNDTYFQAALKKLFPTWDVIMAHQDVVRFACVLTAETETVLEFVYETLIQHHIKPEMDILESFLEPLCEELSKLASIKPLNNKYMNYVTNQHNQIFIPSKYFVFNLDSEFPSGGTVTYHIDESLLSRTGTTLSADCEIISFRKLPETFRMMGQIEKHVKLLICKILIDSPSGCNFNLNKIILSRNIRTVVMKNCLLSSMTWYHVATQFHGSKEMIELDLSGTGNIPESLGSAISTMPSLQKLQMSNCNMNQATSQSVLLGIAHCTHLVTFDLQQNVLTNNLSTCFGAADHPGFPSLETINLNETQLSEKDVRCLFAALRNGKLPILKNLGFSPVTLTNCLADVLSAADHPAFPFLEKLDLSGKGLTRADLKPLHRAIDEGKLSKMKKLNLSHNTLTNCVKQLRCGSHDLRLSILDELNLSCTRLSKADVKGLSEALTNNKLPKLTHLDLSGNTLTGCLPELLRSVSEHLVHLNLSHARLKNIDVKGLCHTTKDKKFTQLQFLNLSGNTLTDCLKEFFEFHHGFPSLEKLYLANTELSTYDVQSLFAALSIGKLPKLTLTNCLGHILRVTDSEFPFLEELDLNNRGLCQVDLMALCKTARTGKLLKLKKLNLSGNKFTNFVGELLNLSEDYHVLPSLKTMSLENTQLSMKDVKSLFATLCDGKLLELKNLKLGSVSLTNCLQEVLSAAYHPAFPFLKNAKLDLCDKVLSRTDLKALQEAVYSDKLPELKGLNLSYNILTDCLEELFSVPDDHRFSALMELNLAEMELSKADVKSLTNSKFPKLSILDLSGNILTNCLQNLLECISSDLERLNLSYTSVSNADVRSLCQANRNKKFPKLRYLNLHGNTLTDCLEELFKCHHGFPSLEKMNLENTDLKTNDVKCLFSALRDGKLPKFTPTTLANCLGDILSTAHHQAFPFLENLDFSNRELTKTGINCLFQVLVNKKLPKVTNLDLSFNTLTGCLHELLSSISNDLSMLSLKGTQLSKIDINSLCQAIKEKKFMRLTWLQLSVNVLSGCVEELLCGTDDCVLPHLGYLSLRSTSMNKLDLKSLSEALKSCKLPRLTYLHLEDNDLFTMEGEVENLIKTCIEFHKSNIILFLEDNNLSDEFLTRMEPLCQETNTKLKTTKWF